MSCVVLMRFYTNKCFTILFKMVTETILGEFSGRLRGQPCYVPTQVSLFCVSLSALVFFSRAENGDWNTAERQLTHRLIFEAVNMDHIRRICTNTTQLPPVSNTVISPTWHCKIRIYIVICTFRSRTILSVLFLVCCSSTHGVPRAQPFVKVGARSLRAPRSRRHWWWLLPLPPNLTFPPTLFPFFPSNQ